MTRDRSGRGVSLFGQHPVPARLAATPPLDQGLRAALVPARHSPGQLWAGLPGVTLDAAHLAGHHLIARHDEDPVGLLYDHLRTRLVQAMQEKGWLRVAIAAPTRGCGASTVAANLALALARRPSGRTILIDLDLRRPAQAGLFGIADPGRLRDVLAGTQPVEGHFIRIGQTLALGLNDHAEADAAELLQEPATADMLEVVAEDLAPDIMLFDLPPMLESDDVLAFLPEVDGLLLVVDGTRNTVAEVRECERLLAGQAPLIGVVMNRAEDSPARPAGSWWRGRRRG